MTLSVVTSAAAEDDIRDIAEYIARDSAIAAGLFGADLVRVLALIRDFPDIGRPVTHHLRATRVSGRFWRYLVIYQVIAGDRVEIRRVLHGAMDVRAHLEK